MVDRLIALVLAPLLCMAIFSGCARAPEAKKNVKIGVCVYKQNDTFISTIMTHMEKIAKDYELETGIKVDLDIADAKESQRAQNEQIQRFISLSYDAICVNMVDRTTAAPLIDDAVAADIPLIFFNREPVESDIMRGKDIYYVGSDAKTTAVLQGEIIAEAYWNSRSLIDKNGDNKIEYCMLEGEMGHQDAIIRTAWSVQTLTANGILTEKIQSGVANWDRNQAAAFVEQWTPLIADGTVEVIICNNDDMALGAADALEKQGIELAIVGIDATVQGLGGVRDGRLLGTVDCNPAEHAKSIFGMAFGLGLNGEIPRDIEMENGRYVRVPLRKVTKENVEEIESLNSNK